jgi:hypothetical protein
MNLEKPIDVVIPAAVGGAPGMVRISRPGRIITCLSSDAEFSLSKDGGPRLKFAAGRVIGDVTSPEYSWLMLYNASALAITAQLLLSYHPYTGDIPVNPVVNASFSIKNPSTYTKMAGAPAGATTPFNGSDAGKQRKQIIIQNREAAGGNVIEVSDNTNEDDCRFRIAPGQIWTVETNGIIKVTVPAATAEAGVMEIFYT